MKLRTHQVRKGGEGKVNRGKVNRENIVPETMQVVTVITALSNESLKQNMLKRYLEAKHNTSIGKDQIFFERKGQQIK
jgi:hypothetical protein